MVFSIVNKSWQTSFVIFDIVVKKQIECGLAWSQVWSVLLSTTIHVGQNFLWTQHFDHCDDAYRCRFEQ